MSIDIILERRWCWEDCTVNANSQSLLTWHWLHFRGSHFLLLESVLHRRERHVHHQSSLCGLLLQKYLYMCNKINRKKKHSPCNQDLHHQEHDNILQRRLSLAKFSSSCSFSLVVLNVSSLATQGVCLHTYCDTLKHITSYLCSCNNPLLLPKKTSELWH